MQNKTEIRISGLGGQGVVLAGHILGTAAVYSGKYAVQTQSYGAEARGSAAKSEVIVSDGKIGFPSVRKCDILVTMSQTALDRHIKCLKKNGILLVDSDSVKSIPETEARIFEIPATETAKKEFGASIYANMIILGVLTKIIDVVEEHAMETAIKENVPDETIEDNVNAFRKGLDFQFSS